MWLLCFLERVLMDSDGSDSENEKEVTENDASPSDSAGM